MASVAVKNERSNKALAAIITLIIHAGLLLFLLWYIIITPIPPYPEPVAPELELDLAAGGGGSPARVETVTTTKSVTDTKVKATISNTPTVNNDVEPSTPIPSGKAAVQPKKIDTVVRPPQPSIELASAENKFKHAKASGGGTTGQGLQGSGGGGTGPGQGLGVGSGVGSGSGGGKGFGYDLNGRQLEVRPQLVTNNPEQGQIVVAITVDQDGNVTEATPGVIGSTITDASLYVLVKNAALKVKFNRSPNTPEQTGTVTFRFTIR